MKSLMTFVLRASVAGLGLAVLASSSGAQNQGGADGRVDTNAPGEGVGTVPATYNVPDTPRFSGRVILTGTARGIAQSIVRLRGRATVRMAPLRRGGQEIALIVEGDLSLRLDPVAVREHDIRLSFETGIDADGWVGQASVGAWSSVPFEIRPGTVLGIPTRVLGRSPVRGSLEFWAADGAGHSTRFLLTPMGRDVVLHIRNRG